MRDYFMQTARVGFSKWRDGDVDLAVQLWGDPEVTRFICAAGVFTKRDILRRLAVEVQNDREFGVQYWPFFERSTGELIGCCGLRPFKGEARCYENGFHLRKKYRGKGYATEAATAVIAYGFEGLLAERLCAGHHPQNEVSRKLLAKLGFKCVGTDYYEPTGLYHPLYELLNRSGRL